MQVISVAEKRREFAFLLCDRLAMSLPDEQIATLFEGYSLLVEMVKDLQDGIHPSVGPAPRFSAESDA